MIDLTYVKEHQHSHGMRRKNQVISKTKGNPSDTPINFIITDELRFD